MDLWAKEVMSRLERNNASILFGEHAAKDKNLTIEDVSKHDKEILLKKRKDIK